MRSNQLAILSVLALLAASLTLGCTGATTTQDTPTPAPTAANVVTDTPPDMPASTPPPIATDVPGTAVSNGSSDQGELNASADETGSEVPQYDNTTVADNSTAPGNGTL